MSTAFGLFGGATDRPHFLGQHCQIPDFMPMAISFVGARDLELVLTPLWIRKQIGVLNRTVSLVGGAGAQYLVDQCSSGYNFFFLDGKS